MRNKESLLTGSIWKGILLFAVPIMLGQVFQQLYNTVDAFIVGRFLSDEEYAAVTSTGSLTFMLVGFFGGMGVGAGVVIARYYGAKDIEALRKAVHTTMIFGLGAGILISVLGITLTPYILDWMHTPENIKPYSVSYYRCYFLGGVAICLYNLSMEVLRAVGDSKKPLLYLIISSLLNVCLDLLFIGVFRWGVWSAALATTISQFVTMALCIFRLFHQKTVYQLKWKEMRPTWFHMGEIIRYGLPSGVQNSVIAFANVIVQTNINSFEAVAVAACGTYAKLEGFVFLPISCFAMAMTTFVSQNLGARQFDRAKKGTRFGIFCSIIMAEIIGVLLMSFAEPLMRLFMPNNEPAVLLGCRQARVESLFFCCLAFSHCIAGVLRGAGKPLVPMLIMMGSWCVLRVTYISIMVPLVQDIWVVFSAYPLTWTVSSIIYLIIYLKSDWIHAFERRQARLKAQAEQKALKRQ